jgi:integrase
MEIKMNKDGSISYKEKVYLSDGSTSSKTFRRKTDAIRWKEQMRLEIVRNEVLGITPLKENIDFEKVYERWMEVKVLPSKSKKTIPEYQSICKAHLLPAFSRLKIRSFTISHANELVRSLKAKGLKNKTANKVLGIFKQIFKFAEMEGYLHKDPFRGFPCLKVEQGRIDFLSSQEILQLLRANSTEEIYPILVVALNTGMRIGELTGLCWDRINFDTKLIEVSRTMTRYELKDSTKTNLIRHIPMNQEVQGVLWSLMKNQRSPKLVFTAQDGKAYNPDHFSERHFKKALVRSGVREINFHLLRHTFASQFMMNGGNVYDLQKILGHTKVEMTMKYAHLSMNHLSEAMNTVRYSADGDNGRSPFSAPRAKEGIQLSVV